MAMGKEVRKVMARAQILSQLSDQMMKQMVENGRRGEQSCSGTADDSEPSCELHEVISSAIEDTEHFEKIKNMFNFVQAMRISRKMHIKDRFQTESPG